MKKLRTALSVILSVMLLFSAIPVTAFADLTVAGADEFGDFPTGWSNAAMKSAVDNGLIYGYEDNTIRPKELLTRAQIAAIINRAFGAEVKAPIEGVYGDVSTDDWFYDDIAKAVQMRTFNGCGGEECLMRPNDPITREDAVVVISRALVIGSNDVTYLDKFSDKAEVSDYATGSICAFLGRGYLNGYDDNTLKPKGYITREEFSQIMYNIFAAYERRDGAITLGDCEGEVILSGDNVHLSETNVHGDLIIGDGVGNTNVILENVIVDGRIVFRGGEGLVTLRNVNKNGLIVVNDVNGTVNFNHYSTESIFRNAVYNTPASFLDRTVAGGSASGTGLGAHDTLITGNNDAKTGVEKEDTDLPPVYQGTGGGIIYYTVTIDPDNGSSATKYTVKRNSSLKASGFELPEDPEKTGYRFDGWYYEKSGVETEFDENTIIKSSTNVYAKWIKQVNIKFLDDKNGDELITAVIDIDTKLSSSQFPEDPEKTGYTFDKWVYVSGTDEIEFTSSVVVSDDITVYPAWTINKYTVTYMNEGAEYHKEEVEYGSSVTALPKDPEKEHALFLGWYYVDSGAETQFTVDTKIYGDLVVNAKWQGVTYTVTYNVDGVLYDEKTGIEAGKTVGTLPTEPSKAGMIFIGWFYTEGASEVEFTADTPVYGDITVEAKFEDITNTYTVKFYEYGDTDELRYTVSDVVSGSTVSADEISAATEALDEKLIYGYEASADIISDTYPGNVKHEIYGEWYYLKENEYKVFDDTVEVTSDIDVFYFFKNINLNVSLDSLFGEIGKVMLSVPYDDTAITPVTVLDLLWDSTNKEAIKTAANLSLEKIKGRTIKINDLEYMPIDADGQLMNASYAYRLIKLLGEETIRDYTDDAIEDMLKNDAESFEKAIIYVLDNLGDPEHKEMLITCDNYIMSNSSLLDMFRDKIESDVRKQVEEQVRQQIKTQVEIDYPEFTEAEKEAKVNEIFADAATQSKINSDIIAETEEILSDSAKRMDAILEGIKDESLKKELADKIFEKAYGDISSGIESEFANQVLNSASLFYSDEIEEFIDSLKNKDSYLINYDSITGTDRRFIVKAISNKLEDTTYEEIKAKLPSVITKVIDENSLRDIFETTLNNYKAEVNAVKEAVFDPSYNGEEYYIGSSVDVVVNPITQILIPYYDKAMAKLDPAIKGYKYYEENPYIKEIEALMHYDQLVTSNSKTAPYAGYEIKSVDDYYALLYKTAVLLYDAGGWMIDNVPEEELDDTIELVAERIGGYYDRLAEKFSILSSGKFEEAKNTFENLVRKLVSRNNSDLWNTTTDTLINEKLDSIYSKACEIVSNRIGFDISNNINISIASDCCSFTLTQGGKTVTKTIEDIAFDLENSGLDVTINGSVITINGVSVDLAAYAEKIANKIGYNFDVSFIVDTEALSKGNNRIKAYKLNINSDYISVLVYLG